MDGERRAGVVQGDRFTRIGMDRLPYIEFPVVSITTTLKGANPDIVDSSVTNLVEARSIAYPA